MTFNPHPGLHPIFETLAYTVGYTVYRRSRDRRGDFLSDDYRWLIIAAASIGALLGSRFLGILKEVPLSQLTLRNLKTCIHIAHPDGERLIPFDTYNMFYRDTLEQTRLRPLRDEAMAT